MTRIIGCRSSEGHFTVQRIKTVDKVVYKPFSYETEAFEGKTVQHLHLRAARPSGGSSLTRRIPDDVHVYQTLTYAFDDEHKTHGPRTTQPDLADVNSPMVMDVDDQVVEREARRLLTEIVTDLESDAFYVDPTSKFVPAKIDMLRRAFGRMDRARLSAFVDKASDQQEWSTVK